MHNATQLHMDVEDAVKVAGDLIKINGDEAASIRFVAVTEDRRGGEHGRAEVEVRDDDAGRLRQLLRKALVDLNGQLPEPSRKGSTEANVAHLEEKVDRLVTVSRKALETSQPLKAAQVYAVASQLAAAVTAVRRSLG